MKEDYEKNTEMREKQEGIFHSRGWLINLVKGGR